MTSLTLVYVEARNPEDIYEEAKLVKSYNGKFLVRYSIDNEETEVNEKDCLPAPLLGEDGENDMIFLEHLNEAALLHNLRIRFFRKHIYTYTGSILMSVNPYKLLPIYTPAIQRMYANEALGKQPPHAYAISDVCYRSMMTEHKNQSVLISGESGAGKTECAKVIMKYLAHISDTEAPKNLKVQNTTPPYEKILATNPVLEAFGNAKTVRNDNSSRFGKMLDLQFDGTGYMVGAAIRQYLLEEIRIIKQSENERNFHVFYYVCAGADKTERERFSVTEAKDYYYTNQSGIYELPGVNSKYMYIELKRALGTAGISPPEIFNIMKLMCGILWLGNIEFNGDERSDINDNTILNWASLMLEVEPQELKKALITRENNIRGETFIVPLKPDEARNSRDTLAKALYSKNFEWIVAKLNGNIDVSNDKQFNVSHDIMLLDIFGFEVFKENYFEQFCINYANERLQFEFNEHIFRLEQEVYKSENIDITDFTYEDNKPTIQLIEKKPQGILWLLDEQAKFPRSSDESFYNKITNVHKRHKQFVQPRFSKHEMIIKHFAGDVTYDTRGFLEKTKSRLGLIITRMMKNSKQKQYVNLFKDIDITKGTTAKSKLSVGLQFRNALAILMKDIKATEPHYVRCIKPNELKSHKHFNSESVLRQLRCSGVLETIRIRQGGYPNRRLFKEFLDRYRVLAPNTPIKGNVRKLVEIMCKELGMEKTDYKLGISKVFLKDKSFHTMEGKRNKIFTKSSTIIQTYWRGYNDLIEFWLIKASSQALQYWIKEYLIAADPSEEVKLHIKSINEENTDGKKVVESIMNLEKLGTRDKNVDIICHLGGVQAIINAAKKFKDNNDVKKACTRALTKFSNNEENSTRVARSGGVKQMVKHVDDSVSKSSNNSDDENDDDEKDDEKDDKKENENEKEKKDEKKEEKKDEKKEDKKKSKQESIDLDDTQVESIQLIDKLASVKRNVNIVIKEKTVTALKNALIKTNKKDDKSSDENRSFLASKALGTITSHRKAARHIGRDEEAISVVLNSIRNKPKFGRLVTYSLNCVANLAQNKHNWESMVELGTVDVAMMAFKEHIGNPGIVKECMRLFKQLCKNKEYAKLLVDNEVIPTALEHLKKNCDGCGVDIMSMLDDVLTAVPSAGDKLVSCDGINVIANSLKKGYKRPDVATSIIATCNLITDIDTKYTEAMAHTSLPKSILSALQIHPQLANLSINAIKVLNKFAKLDPTILDLIKSEGAVTAISMAMEKNPELAELISIGVIALQTFADENDLRHAMDIIARSRMETDSFGNTKITTEAIGIVANLALLTENVDYIVSEGGISVFLSICAGKIKDAKANIEDAMVLASGIRAVGRLLKTSDRALMFKEEGGIQTLRDVIVECNNREVVMNAVVDSIFNLCNTKEGKNIIANCPLLPLLTEVFHKHSNYNIMTHKLTDLIKSIALNNKKLMEKLLDEGLIEGIQLYLQKNSSKSNELIHMMQFMKELVEGNPSLCKLLVQQCSQVLIDNMKLHKLDPDVLHNTYELLYKFVGKDPNSIIVFKEKGFEQALVDILDQKDIDPNIYNETNEFLTTLVSNEKIISALDEANSLAQELLNTPNNINLIEELDKRMMFISNICGTENKYSIVIDNGGLILLPTVLEALNNAKICLAREKAIKSSALCAFKLAQFGTPEDIVDDGCYSQMVECYLKNEAYDGLAEYLAKLTSLALKDNTLINSLHEYKAVETMITIIDSHPLDEDLCALAAVNLSKLAFNQELANNVLELGGPQAILKSLANMMGGTDTELIQALAAIGEICVKLNDSSWIDKNGMELLIETLSKREEEKIVQEAMKCVRGLCSDNKFREKFVECGGMEQVIKDINHFNKPIICGPGLEILAMCAQYCDPNKLKKNNAINTIYNKLKLNPDNEFILGSCVAALASLALVTDLKNEIVSNKTIQFIQDALAAKPNDPNIINSLSKYVINVVGEQEPEMIDLITNSGLLDALKVAKDVFVNNKEIFNHIELALNSVNPNCDSIIKQLLLSVSSKDSKKIQRYINDLNKRILMQDPGIKPKELIDALVKTWNEIGVTDVTIGKELKNIFNQMSKEPEFCDLVLKSGIVKNFLELAAKDPKNHATDALELVNNLVVVESGAKYLNDIKAPEYIIKLIKSGNEENENISLKAIKALFKMKADITTLVNEDLIKELQLITAQTNNLTIGKECLNVLNTIVQSMGMTKKINVQEINDWAKNIKVNFDENNEKKILSDLVNGILNNCEVFIKPKVDKIEVKIDNVDTNNIGLPPPVLPPTPVVMEELKDEVYVEEDESEVIFQKALDRRLSQKAQQEALNKLVESEITEERMQQLINQNAIERLIGALQGAKDRSMQAKLVDVLEKMTGDGDENYAKFIGAGGVKTLFEQLKNNLDNEKLLSKGLDIIGNMSKDPRLKTLLGMHNVILLILQVIRNNPDKVSILGKSVFSLSNLAYGNASNVTQIIELSGINDILSIIKRHIEKENKLMQSCLDLLSNCCHNSDKNRRLIAQVGCDKGCLNILHQHSKNSDVVQSGLRLLGNLAFIPDNVPKLVKKNAVTVIVTCMTNNLKSEHVLQMGSAVLSNLAADKRVSQTMVKQGVLKVIKNISSAFPDLIELQKSCLGCLGNLCIVPENAVALIEIKGHLRIFEIMEELDFEQIIVKLCLQLLKMLCVNMDMSNELVRQGACKHLTRMLEDNLRYDDIIRLLCQTLCKLCLSEESARIVSEIGLVDALVAITKEGKNFAKTNLMMDIMKVYQNLCIIEFNAQGISRGSGVPILKAIEVNSQNTIFLNVSATLLANLGIFGTASRHLVKRGAVAVCLAAIKHNIEYKGIVAKFIRCLANFLLTDNKSYKVLVENNAQLVIEECQSLHPNHKQLQKACRSYLKAIRMKSRKLGQGIDKKSKALRDRVDISIVRLITAGTIIKKYSDSSKPRKKKLISSPDCEYLIFEDPNGKKAPKQLVIRSVKDIRAGACTVALRRKGLSYRAAKPDRCFGIFSLDPNGKEFSVSIETKEAGMCKKWVESLTLLVAVAQTNTIVEKGSMRQVFTGPSTRNLTALTGGGSSLRLVTGSTNNKLKAKSKSKHQKQSETVSHIGNVRNNVQRSAINLFRQGTGGYPTGYQSQRSLTNLNKSSSTRNLPMHNKTNTYAHPPPPNNYRQKSYHNTTPRKTSNTKNPPNNRRQKSYDVRNTSNHNKKKSSPSPPLPPPDVFYKQQKDKNKKHKKHKNKSHKNSQGSGGLPKLNEPLPPPNNNIPPPIPPNNNNNNIPPPIPPNVSNQNKPPPFTGGLPKVGNNNKNNGPPPFKGGPPPFKS